MKKMEKNSEKIINYQTEPENNFSNLKKNNLTKILTIYAN